MDKDDGSNVVEEIWRECTKNEICDGHIPPGEYRPRTDDDGFVDNFVEKFDDFLCRDKFTIGLIGSLYLIGVVCSLIFVPVLADKCGRKIPFTLTIVVSLLA